MYKRQEELRRFIIEDLHSGATVYESYGAYNMQKRREIITIVDKAEYQKLMSYMNREDPQAFITVYTCLLYTSGQKPDDEQHDIQNHRDG